MRKLIFLIPLLLHAADPAALKVQRDFDRIKSGKVPRGSVFVFSEAEMNAWVRYKLPSIVPRGVRNPRLELGNGTATANALVNFLEVRNGQGVETNWLISKLIDGEKPVTVIAQIQSGGGKATVHLERVEISGLAISGSTLDFFITNFFRPLYPDAHIDEPFELDYNIDRIDVRPGQVRIAIRK